MNLLHKGKLRAMLNRGCGNPKCKDPHADGIAVWSLCHLGEGLSATIREGGAELELRCRACGRYVGTVPVQAEPEGWDRDELGWDANIEAGEG